jgi:hypothetical protein
MGAYLGASFPASDPQCIASKGLSADVRFPLALSDLLCRYVTIGEVVLVVTAS